MATITSISPTQGKVGDTVTITGTSLSTTASVNFGGTTVTPATVSASTVTFVVPSAAPCSGQVQISVNLSNGTKSNAVPFFIISAPTTTTSSPACLPTGGGPLTVHGSGLAVGGTVTVGTAGSVAFPSGGSNTTVTVTAPAHTPTPPACFDSHQITVTTTGGTGTAGTVFVNYQNPPAITGTDTASGTAGDSVTISGDCFDNLESVTFTDASTPPHTETAVIDSSVGGDGGFVVTTVPDGTLVPSATPGTITVTTCGGTATTPFTIT
jgi:hypothetical protein